MNLRIFKYDGIRKTKAFMHLSRITPWLGGLDIKRIPVAEGPNDPIVILHRTTPLSEAPRVIAP